MKAQSDDSLGTGGSEEPDLFARIIDDDAELNTFGFKELKEFKKSEWVCAESAVANPGDFFSEPGLKVIQGGKSRGGVSGPLRGGIGDQVEDRSVLGLATEPLKPDLEVSRRGTRLKRGAKAGAEPEAYESIGSDLAEIGGGAIFDPSKRGELKLPSVESDFQSSVLEEFGEYEEILVFRSGEPEGGVLAEDGVMVKAPFLGEAPELDQKGFFSFHGDNGGPSSSSSEGRALEGIGEGPVGSAAKSAAGKDQTGFEFLGGESSEFPGSHFLKGMRDLDDQGGAGFAANGDETESAKRFFSFSKHVPAAPLLSGVNGGELQVPEGSEG